MLSALFMRKHVPITTHVTTLSEVQSACSENQMKTILGKFVFRNRMQWVAVPGPHWPENLKEPLSNQHYLVYLFLMLPKHVSMFLWWTYVWKLTNHSGMYFRDLKMAAALHFCEQGRILTSFLISLSMIFKSWCSGVVWITVFPLGIRREERNLINHFHPVLLFAFNGFS